ncbi:HYR-like domain-containing protein, partial [Flavobacterium sp.]|uniref:HYR-like domain-containing protein n=1 Tax=Flavobacterium sp. TaxID=239 RepID=UPI002FDCD307
APVAPEAPANVTVACAADVPAMISLTATDNCGAQITVEGVDATTPGNCEGTFTVTRTWTFVDACGNTSSVSQTINVVDDVAPVAPEAPANVTVACAGDVPAMISLTATDNCGDFITVDGVDSISEGNCLNTFTVTRTWTFTDACGNTSSVSQTINVVDDVAPIAPVAPADVTVTCAGDIPAMISLTATDNCSGEITVQGVDTVAPGSCANTFTVTRTWTFSDACGNSTSISQIINVNDTVAPTFNEQAPADTNASCDDIPAAAVLTASDNCGNATVTMTENTIQGNCPSNYQIVRTWTATDACGNTTTVVQIINVSDTTGPVLVGQLEPKIEATCDNIPAPPVLVFTDNCSAVGTPVYTETQTPAEGGVYTITRTWVVSDACGNLSQEYTQFVFVTLVADIITLPSVQTSNDIDENISLDALLPAGATGGVWTNVNNVGGFNAQNNTFNPLGIPAGDYLFSYTISDGPCPVTYEVLIIVGQVNPCEAVIIHNVLTPNGDAFNEYFNIENIEDFDCYPTNKVEIYNRWGILVYETKNYDNNTRRFEGISEGRATVSKSEELPTGTYFYIIEWTTTDGTRVTKDGYLYLTR